MGDLGQLMVSFHMHIYAVPVEFICHMIVFIVDLVRSDFHYSEQPSKIFELITITC